MGHQCFLRGCGLPWGREGAGVTRLSSRLYFLQPVTSAGGACAGARAAKPGKRDQGRPVSAASARLQGRSVEPWSQQGGSLPCRRAQERELQDPPQVLACWARDGGEGPNSQPPQEALDWCHWLLGEAHQIQPRPAADNRGEGFRAENSGIQANFPESQLSLAQPAPVVVSRASSAVPLSWAVTPSPIPATGSAATEGRQPLYMSPGGREAGALCPPLASSSVLCRRARSLGFTTHCAWGPRGPQGRWEGPLLSPRAHLAVSPQPHRTGPRVPLPPAKSPQPGRKPKSPWALGRPRAAGVLGKPPRGKAHPVFLLCSTHAAACSPA